jgi:intein/homing endonuclease
MAGFSLFGYEIKKQSKKGKDKSENNTKGISFVAPNEEEGTDNVVSALGYGGGAYGHYMDIDGTAAKNERDLIFKYRDVAQHPECDSAIEDIVNEAIVSDGTTSSVSLSLDDVDQPDRIKELIRTEFDKIIEMLDFSWKGHEIFRKWYVDGRLYYHKVIDDENPKKGIVDLRLIDPTRIRKVRDVKEEVDSKTGVKLVKDSTEFFIYQNNSLINNNMGLRISKDSITFVTSGAVDPSQKRVLSYLHKALKPVNQLRMMEDALIIYRLSRAPERRVFYIDVGNLPKGKAEEYMRAIMAKHRNKIVYDQQTGDIKDNSKHMSILEDFWLPRREGCLDLSTKISLLDGRDVELFQLILEYQAGIKNWTYSVDHHTGEIMPGLISWAGITRKNSEIVKVYLNNGKIITATPDHKFILSNGEKVEAKDLKTDDHLMPFMGHDSSIKNAKEIESVIVNKMVLCDKRMDVGTLTIDEHHIHHSHHNFALTDGIFVMNSRGTEISTLPGGCLDLHTKVRLNDGRLLNILEIESELKEQNELWTISCDPITGEIVPGLISWAGLTQRNVEVMRITLSNEKDIICTPDHKFPVMNLGFVRADELKFDHCIISGDDEENLFIDRIEWLSEKMDVGTLTIDSDEIYHDYHTFLLDAGIFTKNSSLGEIEDIEYFRRRLYKSLNVPVSRLEQDNGFNLGKASEITRDELKFHKFILRLRKRFSFLFVDMLKTQVILKGILDYDEWQRISPYINIKYAHDNHFAELKAADILSDRLNLLSSVENHIGVYFSKEWVRKNVLMQTDKEIEIIEEQIAKEKEAAGGDDNDAEDDYTRY